MSVSHFISWFQFFLRGLFSEVYLCIVIWHFLLSLLSISFSRFSKFYALILLSGLSMPLVCFLSCRQQMLWFGLLLCLYVSFFFHFLNKLQLSFFCQYLQVFFGLHIVCQTVVCVRHCVSIMMELGWVSFCSYSSSSVGFLLLYRSCVIVSVNSEKHNVRMVSILTDNTKVPSNDQTNFDFVFIINNEYISYMLHPSVS